MKFAGYLTEGVKNRKQIKEILDRDCAQYLKEIKYEYPLLFRGSHKPTKDIRKVTHRKNRNPSDTPKPLHDKLNDLFEKRFGWPVRGGIFTVPSKSIADNYGTPFVFFPIGDYKYVYSPKIEDLFQYFDDMEVAVSFDNDVDEEVEAYDDFMFDRIIRHIRYKKGKGMKFMTKSGKSIINLDKYIKFLDSKDLKLDMLPEYDILSKQFQFFIVKRSNGFAVDKMSLVDWDQMVSFDEFIKIRESKKNKLDKVIMDAVKTYKDTGLYNYAVSTAGSRHEITFWCDYYYLVDEGIFTGDWDGVFDKGK